MSPLYKEHMSTRAVTCLVVSGRKKKKRGGTEFIYCRLFLEILQDFNFFKLQNLAAVWNFQFLPPKWLIFELCLKPFKLSYFLPSGCSLSAFLCNKLSIFGPSNCHFSIF
ncbi:unnamed protein product [Ilex paraguariensis]|uniref:Uncharacterized protein n=1 Tax=Ilex paraguariensis TaxID=185542 RepID=A0ABC8UF99_9AQUA